MSRRRKSAGHANFAAKVAAIHAKGHSWDSAKRIAGAMVRDAAKMTTKAGRKAAAAVAKKAHQLHLRYFRT